MGSLPKLGPVLANTIFTERIAAHKCYLTDTVYFIVASKIGFRFFDLFSPYGPLNKGVSYFVLVDCRG
jgi:hypothetical protein